MNKFILRACAAVLGLSTIAVPAAWAETFSLEQWKSQLEQEQSIDEIARLYLAIMFETNPIDGGSYGIHGIEADPAYYDDRLGDPSAEGWASAYEARNFLLQRLESLNLAELSLTDQVDVHILKTEIELANLEVSRLGEVTDPLTYVERLGGAFSDLVLRDYAPLDRRLRSFGKRCAATGGFLDGARSALLPPYVQPTAVQKQVAVTRLQGLLSEGGLFDKTLPDLLESSNLSDSEVAAILEACASAVTEVAAFTSWFETAMLPRPDDDWRLGPELYGAKYALYMDYPLDPQELLDRAESALETTYAEMVSVSRRIHDEYLADGIAAGEFETAAELSDNQVVRDIFTRIAEDRSTAETLIEDSYALADAIVGFVEEKDLLDLPPTSKLRIENIPPHLAGYAVAQITPAPPFQPDLESVWFWDLGVLATSDSYLKEYNRPTLAMIYIHEGVPGHFVQLEYSNQFERIIPKIFRNGPMVEGWATYIATQLVAEGFTIYPEHEFGHELQKLVDDKLILRSIMNAIIDIRLHTTDWPEEDAIKLMVEKGFQEEGEAQGKLVRAKLSSVQLASYFAGHIAILELLEDYRKLMGPEFSIKTFNERLVSAGSPPFFVLREEMLKK
ncbi:MAG: DUF885 domain-containing protein [Gammaproteobacteria bacterium]